MVILKEKKYTATFILSLFISFSLLSSVYLVSMKENPITLTSNFDNQIFTFLPQGWAFFTRNPREAQISIYEIKNGKLYDINQKHSSASNIFGLKRNASKILSELQIAILKIKKEEFVNLNWNYQSKIYDKIPQKIHYSKNILNSPLLCKEYLIIFQKPVPWAWSKSIEKIKMEAKGIRIKFQCYEKN
jgi:antimicrobial peptide system SdpA family protein